MSDPRDRIGSWLDAEVEPLTPRPGTFERIRHRARRRKAGRAMMSAAGMVIVIAAAATVPHFAPSLLGRGGPARPSVIAGSTPRAGRPARAHARHSGPGTTSSQTATPAPRPSSSLAPPGSSSGAAVPANFQPTSVTFIGTVGAVIGQALTPGHCASIYCTSLAGTSDYGTNWYGVSAPPTGQPAGSLGVSQVRFLTLRNGWAFGPQLWVTHDGGASWTQEDTRGLRVTDLETVGDRAFALFASGCTGTGADYGEGCAGFALYSSTESSDLWRLTPGAASLAPPAAAAGKPASASLVLVGGPAGGTGYLLAPGGELLSGPLTGGQWRVADSHAPCLPGAPGAGGQPTGGLLAAGASRVWLVCTGNTSGDSQQKGVWAAPDGGKTLTLKLVGPAPTPGIATSLAAGSGTVVLATDAGIDVSGNYGIGWKLAQPGPRGAAAGHPGFGYVGITGQLSPTGPDLGVALPADPTLHEVFITSDGGQSWQPHAVSAP